MQTLYFTKSENESNRLKKIPIQETEALRDNKRTPRNKKLRNRKTRTANWDQNMKREMAKTNSC